MLSGGYIENRLNRGDRNSTKPRSHRNCYYDSAEAD
jgi:hypothetical protein